MDMEKLYNKMESKKKEYLKIMYIKDNLKSNKFLNN